MTFGNRSQVVLVVALASCGDDGGSTSTSDASTTGATSSPTAGTETSSATTNATTTSTGSSGSSGPTETGSGSTTSSEESTGGLVDAASLEFFVNDPDDYDYGLQLEIPPGFGEGEFTLELWIRPNESFPIGPVEGGQDQLQNWSDVDNQPYSNGSWWYDGNFLLDGHNNGDFAAGTFSLQFYGGGRVRWLFGDGLQLWSAGAYPADGTPSLLDGAWHQLTMVRRWAGATEADLELWIDGGLVATETSNVRQDMRTWWDAWAQFPGNQEGWFWGVEKQAAVGVLSQYEDYKGLVSELRFWSLAKQPAEIMTSFDLAVVGDEPGLVGVVAFDEGQGSSACDALTMDCITLINVDRGAWSEDGPPLQAP